MKTLDNVNSEAQSREQIQLVMCFDTGGILDPLSLKQPIKRLLSFMSKRIKYLTRNCELLMFQNFTAEGQFLKKIYEFP